MTPSPDAIAPTSVRNSAPLAQPIAIAVFAAALACVVSIACISDRPLRFDDAYMYARYAKHALAGYGFSWNIGEGPRYGCTSALFLWLVTAVRGVSSASDATVLTSLSLTFHVLFALAVALLARLILPAGSLRQRLVPWLSGAFLLLQPGVLSHAFTGMETTLSAALNTCLVVAACWHERERKRFSLWLTVACAALSYLARPDNLFYAALFAPMLWLSQRPGQRRDVSVFVLALGIVLAAAVGCEVWLFGSALPLPVYAKTVGLDAGYVGVKAWPIYAYWLDWLQMTLPFWWIALATTRRGSLSVQLAALLPVALTFASLGTAVQIMGVFARMYVPSIAFMVYAGCSALAHAEQPTRKSAWRWLCASSLAVLVILPQLRTFAVDAWTRGASAWAQPVSAKRRFAVKARVPLPELGWSESLLAASDMASRLPQRFHFAASEHGYLGAVSPRLTIIDLTGLHDARIAHAGFSGDAFFAQRPDVIWLPPSDYTSTVAAIVDHPTFREHYAYYPGVLDYGLAWRREPEIDSVMRPQLEQIFASYYPKLDAADYLAVPKD